MTGTLIPEFWTESEMSAQPASSSLMRWLRRRGAAPSDEAAEMTIRGERESKPARGNRRRDGYLADIW